MAQQTEDFSHGQTTLRVLRLSPAFETSQPEIELFYCFKSVRDMIWAMNVALAMSMWLESSRVLQCLRAPSPIVRTTQDAFDWRGQDALVGKRERNLVLLGLARAGYIELHDLIPLDERAKAARVDGYPF